MLERLTLYALMKFRKYGWCSGCSDKVEWAAPGGSSPADVALEAINRVLTGLRKYDPTRYRDFHDFLRSVVDSLAFHLVEKAVGRQTGRMPTKKEDETGELVEAEIVGPARSPCDICICRETIELVKAWYSLDDVIVRKRLIDLIRSVAGLR